MIAAGHARAVTHTDSAAEAAWAPLWLAHPRAQEGSVAGGKAAPLARLAAAGVPVPPGFVVPAAAYEAAVWPLREAIEAALGGVTRDTPARELETIAAGIRELVTARPMDEGLAAALDLETAGLLEQPLGGAPRGAERPLVAVRSSATAEDLPDASFAGQYDTYLGLESAEAVRDAVRRCWASYWSARAIQYRGERGIEHWRGAMGVLVQRLVPADAAGVAFTAHPTTGHRYLLTVNAALGLGQGVVDGTVPADELAVDKDLRRVVLRNVKQKNERVGASGGGTVVQPVDAARATEPALTDEQLLRLLDLACGIERAAGVPQDVEWAVWGGELFILQSRAITALPADPAAQIPETAAWEDLRDRGQHWRLATDRADEQKPRLIGALQADVRAMNLRAGHLAAYLTGRERRPVVRMIGPYAYTASVDAFPDGETRRTVRDEFDARVERYRAAGRCMYRDEQEAELEATNARLHAFDREGATDAALADHLEDAGRAFVRHWTLHWYWFDGDWGGDAPEGRKHQDRWGAHYRRLTGDLRKDAHVALLAGLPNRLTAAIDRVMALARIAQRTPPLREALERREPAAFLAEVEAGALPGAARFGRELEALLAEQGLRSGAGNDADTDVLTPGWGAQPTLVLEIVRGYLPKDISRLRRRRRAADRARERRAAAARARVGEDADRLAEFDRAYAAACESARWFEDHNYLIDSATQSLHYLALDAARRRLVSRGLLDSVDDVVWLHVKEMCDALRADESRPLRALVEERRAERERWSGLTPPAWLGAPPPPPKGRTPERQAAYEEGKAEPARREGTDADRVIARGEGGSRGVATGRVRIIPTDTPVPEVEAGDILVARAAGPLWTPVFPSLGGIILQRAQFFQHAMLTAREYGVPAVFNVKDVLTTLREGETVTVDGTRGLVLRPAEGAESGGAR